jgi:hypothetical protein
VEGSVPVWEADKLILFLGFVIPGFIALKTYELLSPRLSADSSKQVIDAVAYSSINYAILLWPIYEIERHGIQTSHPKLYVLFWVFALLMAPILCAFAYWGLRKTQLFQSALPHPVAHPWEYVFSKRKPYWVIITLKDGSKLAGRYDSQSFASSGNAYGQLYLEESWMLNEDGGLERMRRNSAGILVLATDMVSVEFFNMTYGGANGNEGTEGQIA